MRLVALLSLLALLRAPLATAAEGATDAAPPGSAEPARLAAARDAVYPALVNITVVSEHFADGRAVRYPAAGSGVIVTPEGHVLTNFHVAGNSTRITCTLSDGAVYDAAVVAQDPLTDLSVLKLKLPVSAGASAAVPYAHLGDSGALQVGDPVLAMGNPLALSSSVTLGIVSNPRRVFTDFTGSELQDLDLGEGERTGIFTRWIQHDALILPGNSGGPLVDLAGRVVGINELGGGGIGFAIPSDMAARVLEQALANGEVRRGWLGMTVLPVSKLGRDHGALVSGVLPGSAAAAAGLAPGDILLELAGEPVDVRFLEQVPVLYQRIAELPVGDTVQARVERAGKRLDLSARVARMEPFRGEEAEVRELGLTVQEITGPMALSRSLPSADGLLVTGVRPGYPCDAAKPQVMSGDVLLSFDHQALSKIEDLHRAVDAAKSNQGIVAELRRGRQVLLTAVELDGRSQRPYGGELPKAWLGVRTQVVTPELAAVLGVTGRTGFRVSEVYPWTEASKAGLAVGDLVIAVDGEPFRASRQQDAEELRRAVERRSVGDQVDLTVVRDGAERHLAVALEAEPTEATEAEKARQEELELSVRDLTFLDRIDQGWEREQKGVLVVEVTQGGWAHMAGLRLGDLVMTVDGDPVDDVKGFRKVMSHVLEARPKVVQIFVRRGYRTHFVFIEPDWASLEGRPSPDEAPGRKR